VSLFQLAGNIGHAPVAASTAIQRTTPPKSIITPWSASLIASARKPPTEV
jgi:hypothetical protein